MTGDEPKIVIKGTREDWPEPSLRNRRLPRMRVTSSGCRSGTQRSPSLPAATPTRCVTCSRACARS